MHDQPCITIRKEEKRSMENIASGMAPFIWSYWNNKQITQN